MNPTTTGAQVLKRTFEAARHPPGSGERSRLNRDTLTSEYMPSHKYMTRRPALMSDGTPNPAQKFHDDTFRTKADAIARAIARAGRPAYDPSMD